MLALACLAGGAEIVLPCENRVCRFPWGPLCVKSPRVKLGAKVVRVERFVVVRSAPGSCAKDPPPIRARHLSIRDDEYVLTAALIVNDDRSKVRVTFDARSGQNCTASTVYARIPGEGVDFECGGTDWVGRVAIRDPHGSCRSSDRCGPPRFDSKDINARLNVQEKNVSVAGCDTVVIDASKPFVETKPPRVVTVCVEEYDAVNQNIL